MGKDKLLRVLGCPYCAMLNNFNENIKLHYPESIEKVKDSDFIIIEMKDYPSPIVIFGEHIAEITSETWGRMLYRCKMLFGNNIQLKEKKKIIDEHWSVYCEIRKY